MKTFIYFVPCCIATRTLAFSFQFQYSHMPHHVSSSNFRKYSWDTKSTRWFPKYHSPPSTSLWMGGLDDLSEITSTLSLLNAQWQNDQKSSSSSSPWKQINIPKAKDPSTNSSPEEDKDKDKDKDNDNDNDNPISSNNDPEEFIYYLPPQNDPTKLPSSIILFLGGVGLGQYPQITYSNLFTRISKKNNAAVIAAPYNVQLDHFQLAKTSGDLLRRAVLLMEDEPHLFDIDLDLDSDSDLDLDQSNDISEIPKYALCHSLGAKLLLIFMAATQFHLDLKGIGLMAFNNFGFTDSIRMTRSFFQKNNDDDDDEPMMNKNNNSNPQMDSIFQFATQVINTIGIEFSPSPTQMETLLQAKFTSEMQQKCRLFTFDEDDLDSTSTLLDLNNDNTSQLTSRLEGTHLTPVYFQFRLSDLEVDDQVLNVMGQFTNNIQQISWGDEIQLDALVEEINDWMNGKPPSIAKNRNGLLLGVVDAELE